MKICLVTTKGRISIPAELRKKLGIKRKTHIDWTAEKGRLVLTPVTHELRKRREKS